MQATKMVSKILYVFAILLLLARREGDRGLHMQMLWLPQIRYLPYSMHLGASRVLRGITPQSVYCMGSPCPSATGAVLCVYTYQACFWAGQSALPDASPAGTQCEGALGARRSGS
jgi:hypothetical protein